MPWPTCPSQLQRPQSQLQVARGNGSTGARLEAEEAHHVFEPGAIRAPQAHVRALPGRRQKAPRRLSEDLGEGTLSALEGASRVCSGSRPFISSLLPVSNCRSPASLASMEVAVQGPATAAGRAAARVRAARCPRPGRPGVVARVRLQTAVPAADRAGDDRPDGRRRPGGDAGRSPPGAGAGGRATRRGSRAARTLGGDGEPWRIPVNVRAAGARRSGGASGQHGTGRRRGALLAAQSDGPDDADADDLPGRRSRSAARRPDRRDRPAQRREPGAMGPGVPGFRGHPHGAGRPDPARADRPARLPRRGRAGGGTGGRRGAAACSGRGARRVRARCRRAGGRLGGEQDHGRRCSGVCEGRGGDAGRPARGVRDRARQDGLRGRRRVLVASVVRQHALVGARDPAARRGRAPHPRHRPARPRRGRTTADPRDPHRAARLR